MDSWDIDIDKELEEQESGSQNGGNDSVTSAINSIGNEGLIEDMEEEDEEFSPEEDAALEKEANRLARQMREEEELDEELESLDKKIKEEEATENELNQLKRENVREEQAARQEANGTKASTVANVARPAQEEAAAENGSVSAVTEAQPQNADESANTTAVTEAQPQNATETNEEQAGNAVGTGNAQTAVTAPTTTSNVSANATRVQPTTVTLQRASRIREVKGRQTDQKQVLAEDLRRASASMERVRNVAFTPAQTPNAPQKRSRWSRFVSGLKSALSTVGKALVEGAAILGETIVQGSNALINELIGGPVFVESLTDVTRNATPYTGGNAPTVVTYSASRNNAPRYAMPQYAPQPMRMAYFQPQVITYVSRPGAYGMGRMAGQAAVYPMTGVSYARPMPYSPAYDGRSYVAPGRYPATMQQAYGMARYPSNYSSLGYGYYVRGTSAYVMQAPGGQGGRLYTDPLSQTYQVRTAPAVTQSAQQENTAANEIQPVRPKLNMAGRKVIRLSSGRLFITRSNASRPNPDPAQPVSTSASSETATQPATESATGYAQTSKNAQNTMEVTSSTGQTSQEPIVESGSATATASQTNAETNASQANTSQTNESQTVVSGSAEGGAVEVPILQVESVQAENAQTVAVENVEAEVRTTVSNNARRTNGPIKPVRIGTTRISKQGRSKPAPGMRLQDLGNVGNRLFTNRIIVTAGGNTVSFTPSHYESYLQIFKTPAEAVRRYSRYLMLKDMGKKRNSDQNKEFMTLSNYENRANGFDLAHNNMITSAPTGYSQRTVDYVFSLRRRETYGASGAQITDMQTAAGVYEGLIFNRIFGGMRTELLRPEAAGGLSEAAVEALNGKSVNSNTESGFMTWLNDFLTGRARSGAVSLKSVIRAVKKSTPRANAESVKAALCDSLSMSYFRQIFAGGSEPKAEFARKYLTTYVFPDLIADGSKSFTQLLEMLIAQVMSEK